MDLFPTQDCHAVYWSLEKHRFTESCRSSKSRNVSSYNINTQIPLVQMTTDLTRGSLRLGKLSAAGWLSQVPIFAQQFKRYRWQQRLPVVLLNVTGLIHSFLRNCLTNAHIQITSLSASCSFRYKIMTHRFSLRLKHTGASR